MDSLFELTIFFHEIVVRLMLIQTLIWASGSTIDQDTAGSQLSTHNSAEIQPEGYGVRVQHGNSVCSVYSRLLLIHAQDNHLHPAIRLCPGPQGI